MEKLKKKRSFVRLSPGGKKTSFRSVPIVPAELFVNDLSLVSLFFFLLFVVVVVVVVVVGV